MPRIVALRGSAAHFFSSSAAGKQRNKTVAGILRCRSMRTYMTPLDSSKSIQEPCSGIMRAVYVIGFPAILLLWLLQTQRLGRGAFVKR